MTRALRRPGRPQAKLENPFFRSSLWFVVRFGTPPWCPFFPLAVRELPNVRAIEAHDEDVTIGLRRIGVDDLVLVALARRREHDVLTVRRPRHMGVVPVAVGQLPETGSIRLYCTN